MATINDLGPGFSSLSPTEKLSLISTRRLSRQTKKVNHLAEKKKTSKELKSAKNAIRGLSAEQLQELKTRLGAGQ